MHIGRLDLRSDTDRRCHPLCRVGPPGSRGRLCMCRPFGEHDRRCRIRGLHRSLLRTAHLRRDANAARRSLRRMRAEARIQSRSSSSLRRRAALRKRPNHRRKNRRRTETYKSRRAAEHERRSQGCRSRQPPHTHSYAHTLPLSCKHRHRERGLGTCRDNPPFRYRLRRRCPVIHRCRRGHVRHHKRCDPPRSMLGVARPDCFRGIAPFARCNR